MFNTPIVEVAIGMIFIFSLMALLVTQINTFVTNLLKLRAKQLRQGLQQLVQDDKLRAEIMIHPLINMISKQVELLSLHITPEMAEEVNAPNAPLNDVTYIPSKTFVEALIGILLSRSGADIYAGMREAVETVAEARKRSELAQLLQNLQDDPRRVRIEILEKAIAPAAENAALIAALTPLKTTLEAINYQTSELIPLLNGVAKINNPAFREAISVILTTAKNMDDARAKLENWFNDGMDRASELYKRKIQYLSLVAAFVIAVLLNVDTLYLGQTLWQNPDLRRQVVATAKRIDPEMVSQPTPTATPPPAEAESLQATAEPSASGDTSSEDDLSQELDQNTQDIGTTVQKLLDLQLPLGWEFTEVTPDMITLAQEIGLPDPRTNARNFWNLIHGDLSLILQKILGLLATTIAAAQGAPFWFDLLNRITRGNNNSSGSSSSA
ncbi:MAG TPA: hypothetical protein VHL11_20910 [Phototrophicaceae bacterium]|jgi:hypothetical protein|nr:hypothetical protein [Phototrophicaceae bacterium]